MVEDAGLDLDPEEIMKIAKADPIMGKWLVHWIDWRTKQARPEQICKINQLPDIQGHLFIAGRGFGKLVSIETPVPTPSGWATMGDIKVGDRVFDEAGKPCNVLYVSPEQFDDTYKIIFSDGSEIIAGASHQWVTWNHAERKSFLRSPYEDTSLFPENWTQWRVKRKSNAVGVEKISLARELLATGMKQADVTRITGLTGNFVCRIKQGDKSVGAKDHQLIPTGPQIRTTEDIRGTAYYGKRRDSNHCIPLCSPLDLPSKELPIESWCLHIGS